MAISGLALHELLWAVGAVLLMAAIAVLFSASEVGEKRRGRGGPDGVVDDRAAPGSDPTPIFRRLLP